MALSRNRKAARLILTYGRFSPIAHRQEKVGTKRPPNKRFNDEMARFNDKYAALVINLSSMPTPFAAHEQAPMISRLEPTGGALPSQPCLIYGNGNSALDKC